MQSHYLIASHTTASLTCCKSERGLFLKQVQPYHRCEPWPGDAVDINMCYYHLVTVHILNPLHACLLVTGFSTS